ncbi:glycerophosphodiester phosphodiesterase family protein [Corynebacterium mendelii]|uniref:Glycerophosphoryl diester phosphodiesterase membrane domain-containing protein n=1 Tax=Corynebacterium mendelii TaxID=2765362 RepID=A0A939IYJ7_9CORY|nr:glycerophosphodiester phosphodiesterase family protein [Corynebacterium mendelii]MBN9645188.1 glycerophosphoryl diester phosphodiesterase membrane domain-containing protein [Corynebacterium mendelii]
MHQQLTRGRGKDRANLKWYREAAPELVKYQVILKIVQVAVIFPGFSAMLVPVLAARGIPVLTNDNATKLLFSVWGPVVVVGGLLLLMVTVLLEIGGFMTVAAIELNGRREAPFVKVATYCLSVLPRIAGPGLVAVAAFAVLVLPLVHNLLQLSIFTGVRIPNFIMEVINGSTLYSSIYLFVLAAAWAAATLLIFWFHGIILLGWTPGPAARLSVRMVTGNFPAIILRAVTVHLIIAAAVAALSVIPWLVVGLGLVVGHGSAGLGVGLTFLGLLMVNIITGVAGFLFAPFEICFLTALFYRFLPAGLAVARPCVVGTAGPVPDLAPKRTPAPIDRLFDNKRPIAVAVIGVIAAGSVYWTTAGHVLSEAPDIAVIAHRGGSGDQVVENTAGAIEQALRQGVDYVEVDVQRTADGHYIINHDATFSRLAGLGSSAQEMTMDQIAQLKLYPADPAAPAATVLTVDGLLDLVDGRTGLFLELKGASADTRMADDLYRMVAERGIVDRVVFFCLKSGVVAYIDETYPDAETAFGYFLSGSNKAALPGDWAAIEEDNLSYDGLTKLHKSGKKVAVWTVNTEASMKKFVNWPVDAVITDHVPQWNRIAADRASQNPARVLVGEYFHG